MRSRRLRRRPFVGIVLTAVLGCLTPPLRAAGPTPADAGSPPTAKSLDFRVVDGATGQPVPAELSLFIDGKESTAVTDADGRRRIEYPAAVRYLSVRTRAAGYGRRSGWWGQGRAGATPPADYTIALEPGKTIGGRVVDDAGQPVGGATVMLHIRGKRPDKPAEGVDVCFTPVKTAADGRWSFDAAPATFDAISVGAYHTRYAIGGSYPMPDVEKHAALFDRSAELVLERGVPVEGVVLGADGEPLAGAKVGVGADRVCSNVTPEVETDENGKFSFGGKVGEMIVVTVKAKGHAPDQRRFVMGKTPKRDLEFRLGPSRTLTGRVVDGSGKPLEGVSLYTDTWRSSRTLDTHLTTDADGRFTWADAPADEVMFDIYKIGYADLRQHPMTASDRGATLTLRKPLRVRGVVVDAETGAPVKAYRVVQGIAFADGRVHWQRRTGDEPAKPRPDGTFEYEQSYPYPGYAARVEADGYLPADSRTFKLEEETVELKFELKKGQSPTGVVRAADGRPAAGAKVVVATTEQTAYIRGGKEIHDQGNVQATADDNGRYSLPAQIGTYALVVVHDAGYAELPGERAAKSGDVTLVPWGKVEGRVLVSGRPGAGSELSIHHMDESYDEKAPRIYHQLDGKADAQGRFTFDRVRPGDVWVSRTVRIPMGGNSWMSANTHTAIVTIEPGKAAQVELGGTGRPVVGSVNIPAEIRNKPAWFFSNCSLMTDLKHPDLAIPDDVKTKTPAERQAWYAEFMKSDAGASYQAEVKKVQRQRRNYAIVVQPDGTFRADDVPAGTYTLSLIASEPLPGSTCGPGDAIGTASAKVVVPEIAGGRSDEPLEVPTLELTARKTVNVGDAAPAFTAKTLDGKDLSLADYKGKYVLLDFWATWCGPCVAETPNLKETYAAFGKDDRFVMVGLSLDKETREPKAYSEQNNLSWVQGFLGDWGQTTVPESYGVNGIPSIWLIGPDGKVIAKGLRGTGIKQAVEAALRK